MATLKSLVKTGFGLGVGFQFASIIFLIIGMAFFIPGYLMFKSASEKKESSTSSSKIGGIILMAIGAAIGGGLGFGALLDSLGDI